MSTLNLLVLRARDPARLAQFYGAFGLSFTREQHGNGPVHHSCELGGAVLEIYPYQESQGDTTGTRLGFRVDSLDRAIAACTAEARILSAPKLTQWGRRAVIQDPEGHKLELTEAVSP
jgi:predicted enzyme related to lactoylglutathione lyase